ncbi:hypothetical protein ACHAWU_003868 [Discostella pseudostelligera]|uniref:Leucine-rich repeat domain-containing protein n=1 Tax=Discostella pseudostelligera TaxID=259834 RepID=A0ABD3MEL0_9STRA
MANKKRKTPPDEEEVADTGDFRSMVNLVQLREVPEQIDTNSLTFSHRNDLVEVELCDGLEKIIDNAFRCCSLLERITIPSSVKVIGKDAFLWCEKLTKVELHEGLEIVDDRAFRCCLSLDHFDAPSTLKEIGIEAFGCCRDLDHVQLNEGLETIGDYAFRSCASLLNANHSQTNWHKSVLVL